MTFNICFSERHRACFTGFVWLWQCVRRFTNRTQNGAGLFVNPTNISCFILFSLGTVWQTQSILICPIFLLRIYGFTEWKLTDTENTIRGIFVLKYWSCIGSHSSKVIIEFVGSNRVARAGKYCRPEPETVSESKHLWVCVSFNSVYYYELIMRRKTHEREKKWAHPTCPHTRLLWVFKTSSF